MIEKEHDRSKPRPDRAAWLEGGEARCQTLAAPVACAFRLVLLGPPGGGKGTQAELLSNRLGACQLSTGDVFRSARSNNGCRCSPALEAAREFMRRGELVPDETVLAMVRERAQCLRCCGGFLLDGFPRTVAQAKALETLLSAEGIALDAVMNYELAMEAVVARLSGRRTCPRCKAVFHVEGRPPRVAGICDHCSGVLFQREDDRPESVRVRLQAYERSTTPLAKFYSERGLLVTIGAEGAPDEILELTLEALEARRRGALRT